MAAGMGVDREADSRACGALALGAGRVAVPDPDASMVSVQMLSDPDASTAPVRMRSHRDANTDVDYRAVIRWPLRMTAVQYSSHLLIYYYWGLDIHTLPVSSPMPNTILSLATVIS